MFSCNLPPALLAEWLGSFMCYCSNSNGRSNIQQSDLQQWAISSKSTWALFLSQSDDPVQVMFTALCLRMRSLLLNWHCISHGGVCGRSQGMYVLNWTIFSIMGLSELWFWWLVTQARKIAACSQNHTSSWDEWTQNGIHFILLVFTAMV